jgi:hypothetical protein
MQRGSQREDKTSRRGKAQAQTQTNGKERRETIKLRARLCLRPGRGGGGGEDVCALAYLCGKGCASVNAC